MSNVKHTSGPWAVRGPEGTNVYLLQNYGFGASGWGIHNVSTEQAKADARLIAAAPDLLDVAKRILDRGYVSESIDEERSDHQALVAAIAKAEGLGHDKRSAFEESPGDWYGF